MEGSTAGEVSHYGTCRSGGIGLILRFVPLGKSPATSSSSGAGSSTSIAGVDEESRAGHCSTAPATSSSSGGQQQQQQQHCRTRHSKMVVVHAPPGRKPS
ncbi:hypothetical protein PR002_g13817 [Phytophthora rubi]|uniref:Uncharacterized protein n=1 Tax=Phytophthora rubi TaxID=129364 RepID=A0A6A3L8J2_9STRA|nr:hypothetical protein PR002_g13817 [Phytophthora rubi]